MARLWSARPLREGGPRGGRAPALVLLLAGVVAATAPVSDVGLYRIYATGFPHRLPVEYPALAGGVFALPRLLPLPYAWGFALLMGAAFLGVLRPGRRLSGLPAAWSERFLTYTALGVVGVLLTRFDLLPAVALVLAVERARSGRWSGAWAWAVVGGLLKLFPFLLLPGFLLAERRATGRTPWARLAGAGGALAAAAAAQSWWAPGTLLRPLGYELHRGFEFSSVPGTLTLLASPTHIHFGFAYGNQQVYGPGRAVIGALMLAAAAAALGAVWTLTARGRMPVEAVALAVVSIAVLTDKALAPQYLLWLAPLWAYWRPRRAWLAGAALTTLVCPVLFLAAGHTGSLYLDTVAAGGRNAVLLVGTLAWAAEGLRTRWAERMPCPDVTEVVPCPVA